MNLKNIKKIELEITSRCNAACPGCARTHHIDQLELNDIRITDIKNIFPNKEDIENKIFKLCGVLGDPVANRDCFDIVEYLVNNGGKCQISTNAGIQTKQWWYNLGKLSKETGLVDVLFCIDGHKETNHIYRINTHFPTIIRNLESYSIGGQGYSSGTWVYIVFDHNEYEIDNAKRDAERLGFKFAQRTGMRNSYHSWLSNSIKKEDNKLVRQSTIITTTGSKEHSRKSEILKIDKFIDNYSNGKLDVILKEEILKSIACKLIHEGEIFIASNLTVWPCCFLWDSYFKNKDNIVEKLKDYDANWNNLNYNSIDKILSHKWFYKILEESWDPTHQLHLPRCIKTCSLNKAYHNEIKVIK